VSILLDTIGKKMYTVFAVKNKCLDGAGTPSRLLKGCDPMSLSSLPHVVASAQAAVNPQAFIPHDRVRAVSADIFYGLTGTVLSVHESAGKQFAFVQLDDPRYSEDQLFFNFHELEGSAERKQVSQ
jgi:hypothetical protein